MDAKTTEQEINTIMQRHVPEWDSLSMQEKKAIFAKVLKKQDVVWNGFTLGQRTWIIRYLGFWKYLAVTADGSGGALALGIVFYWVRVYPKGCLTTLVILVILAAIAAFVAIGAKGAGAW